MNDDELAWLRSENDHYAALLDKASKSWDRLDAEKDAEQRRRIVAERERDAVATALAEATRKLADVEKLCDRADENGSYYGQEWAEIKKADVRAALASSRSAATESEADSNDSHGFHVDGKPVDTKNCNRCYFDALTATTETTVEIGGQVMTQAQFDAARFPLSDEGWAPPDCATETEDGR